MIVLDNRQWAALTAVQGLLFECGCKTRTKGLREKERDERHGVHSFRAERHKRHKKNKKGSKKN